MDGPSWLFQILLTSTWALGVVAAAAGGVPSCSVASKRKNGGVAINVPQEGFINGPPISWWSPAFCYGLPVLYKFMDLLFKHWCSYTINDTFFCNYVQYVWSFERNSCSYMKIKELTSSLYCTVVKGVKYVRWDAENLMPEDSTSFGWSFQAHQKH